jgi:DNA-3-methyladenine glycosylase
MGLPWRSRPHQGWGEPIPPAFFLRDARKVARELLGACLLSSVGAEEVAGVIVEVEAYVGPQDPASHASERVGRTPRNRSMFGAGGNAYVYRSYGVHWCLNAVTGEEGFPAAVLIRGVDPIHGIETARRRREGREPVCAGPGRLCQALGVTGALDGHALREPPLRILEGWRVPDGAVAVSGRVGIRKAAHWPLRFYVLGHPQVSTGPRGLPIQGK